MSWTNCCTESNEFKVKDTKEVKSVLEHMGFIVYPNEDKDTLYIVGDEETFFDENAEVVLSLKPIETDEGLTNLVGVALDCYWEVENMLQDFKLKEEDVMILPIVEYIQDQLVEGSAFILTSAGFEGRCRGNSSPFGDVFFITKNHVEFYSLASYINNKAKELGVEV